MLLDYEVTRGQAPKRHLPSSSGWLDPPSRGSPHAAVRKYMQDPGEPHDADAAVGLREARGAMGRAWTVHGGQFGQASSGSRCASNGRRATGTGSPPAPMHPAPSASAVVPRTPAAGCPTRSSARPRTTAAGSGTRDGAAPAQGPTRSKATDQGLSGTHHHGGAPSPTHDRPRRAHLT
jgi:hypothetical protein